MTSAPPTDFIRQLVASDVAAGHWGGRVVTRFPPEPNGYLHIGHAKSICLNFGIAENFGGICRLRFDDTNPSKEDSEYVEAIIADVTWLTGREDVEVRYASDYFAQMYGWAEQLVERGLAYVDDQDGEAIRRHRGTVTSAGVDSPYRGRSPAENLALLRRMRAGDFPAGACVLRARIDMAHPNMLMRDPLMYRIQHQEHHRTGTEWCIYPLYDWAHGLEDAIEGVTHSLCTLEFDTHRPLYDWFLAQLNLPEPPRQTEFNRLNLTHTVMSKRRLMELVQRGLVAGWDDPRMPTLCGLRRRGVPPEALRSFCAEVGYTRVDTVNEWALLEFHIRQELNRSSARAMAVLNPLRVIIDNWPADRHETVAVPINPENPSAGERQIPFSRELWIEGDDFQLDPPKGFFRLSPGREVRLRGVGLLRCDAVESDETGRPILLRCSLDLSTWGGVPPADNRKVKATIHWIAVDHCQAAEVRRYDHLFAATDPTNVPEGVDWTTTLNPDSLAVLPTAKVPHFVAAATPGTRFQFERLGYVCIDPDSTPQHPIINRTAPLRDPWAKQQRRA